MVAEISLALRWMPLDLTDDKSTLVQVLAWCRKATSHYLSQCWLRSMLPNGVTRPQWVKESAANRHHNAVRNNSPTNNLYTLFHPFVHNSNIFTAYILTMLYIHTNWIKYSTGSLNRSRHLEPDINQREGHKHQSPMVNIRQTQQD